MPKTIDYPRTSYLGAWEVAEVVDDTGGKCAIETAARKLSRKVSGSFKAIIGSAVKFGLLTSKRELLTTTNLFRRIKNAYDKQEERIYHREAFLHPPLFTQICRKFRNRELPVHMFDVMLVREFNVEEINAQSVSKAFVEGARMTGVLNEQNIIADIDLLTAQQLPRRELASVDMPLSKFQSANADRPVRANDILDNPNTPSPTKTIVEPPTGISTSRTVVPSTRTADAVASLFGLDTDDLEVHGQSFGESNAAVPAPQAARVPQQSGQPNKPDTFVPGASTDAVVSAAASAVVPTPIKQPQTSNVPPIATAVVTPAGTFTIHLHGPGLDTTLAIEHIDDIELVQALLNKIRRQLPG